MLSIDLKLISWNDVDSLTVLRLEGYILQLIYLILGLIMNEQIYEHSIWWMINHEDMLMIPRHSMYLRVRLNITRWYGIFV